jgi:hypothetical protein
MTRWKLPPAAKIYEAFGAVADDRVHVTGPDSAEVESSDRDRTYTVEWTVDLGSVAANDNASYWQGYVGYPIVAVLLTLGVLRADEQIVGQLAGIQWHELNARLKRDYDAAVDSVLTTLAQQGADRARIEAEVDGIMAQLATLELERTGRGRRPPKAG